MFFQVFQGKSWCQPRTFDSCVLDILKTSQVHLQLRNLHLLCVLSLTSLLQRLFHLCSSSPQSRPAFFLHIRTAAEAILSSPECSRPRLQPPRLQGLLSLHLNPSCCPMSSPLTHQRPRPPCCLTHRPSFPRPYSSYDYTGPKSRPQVLTLLDPTAFSPSILPGFLQTLDSAKHPCPPETLSPTPFGPGSSNHITF